MIRPLIVTIPHSGEKVPDFCTWLKGLPEPVLMCDVDRYVDRLYEEILKSKQIPFIKTEWHRYAGDLNRVPEDIDRDSVLGNENASGKFSRGFHWVMTTTRTPLLPQPMSQETHGQLIELIYNPFHQEVRALAQKTRTGAGLYHLDLHSMPSVGTSEHRDPGQHRADVVVSDSKGKSCSTEFKDLVVNSYEKAGLRVAYNWPYFGGRITEQYGNPSQGHHVVQVELNRSLYMDEVSKQWIPTSAALLQEKLRYAIEEISNGVDLLADPSRVL